MMPTPNNRSHVRPERCACVPPLARAIEPGGQHSPIVRPASFIARGIAMNQPFPKTRNEFAAPTAKKASL